MTIAYFYPHGLANAFGSGSAGNAPNTDFLSDDIRCALLDADYVFSAAHDFWDDVVADELPTAGNYTANGQALSSKALTITAANAWATQWQATTAYTAGQIVRPTSGNGFVYRCVVGGTSHSSEPTWPTTPLQTVTETGGVVWACVGRAVVQFDAADPSWASATFTARWAIFYNRTPASDATRPLLWAVDFESNLSPSNGTFTVQLNALGIGVATVF